MSDELVWFKSSYSDTEGSNCVEVALAWRKSTYSDTEGSACVELAATPSTIHVRDSKVAPVGPQLSFPPAVFGRFIGSLRS
ncbi:DUF397 domain-containing protein [Streptomyces millisiae]|uniref:DUF397 domain-containing protein n=1 Tax=Streptomyces millisiae TaxID=3075542 RepID=A0ABU2LK89_9ACTN|nr:DUF397 domain-containing protein [Streptomyces sp. DSM 44918]MDT0318004.1 DUF397 domain-containing protein [Streptomyces sp. DSM 44918]